MSVFAIAFTLCQVTANSNNITDVTFDDCKRHVITMPLSSMKECSKVMRRTYSMINNPAKAAIKGANKFPFSYPKPVIKQAKCHKAQDI